MRGILHKLLIITIGCFLWACGTTSVPGAGGDDPPGGGNAADGTVQSRTIQGNIVVKCPRNHGLLMEGENTPTSCVILRSQLLGTPPPPVFATAQITKFVENPLAPGEWNEVLCPECQSSYNIVTGIVTTNGVRVIECPPLQDDQILQELISGIPGYDTRMPLYAGFLAGLRVIPEKLCKDPKYIDQAIESSDGKIHLNNLNVQLYSNYLFLLMPTSPEALALYGPLESNFAVFDSKEQFLANINNLDFLRMVRIVPLTVIPFQIK